MKKINLHVIPDPRISSIIIQDSGLEEAIDAIRGKEGQYVIITDVNVEKLYRKKITKLLDAAKIKNQWIVIAAGEKSKNLQTVEKTAEKLLSLGVTRSDTLIGLGGGMTTDLTGMLASLYMRGMNLIQIPTTLLGMVDASIGGKTGVNLKMGKNLLGTFNQPEKIIINPVFLQTLPEHELKNGIAEIIKYGVIRDAKLFKILEQEKEKILKLDQKTLNTILDRSIEIKVGIVTKDERENGIRMLLNYGHTIGHAIEKVSEYKISHGEAIAIGMVEENTWAIKEGIFSEKEGERIKKLLKEYSLPTEIPKKLSPEKIKQTMGLDKKKRGKTLYLCVPEKIGKAIVVAYS